MQNEIKKGEREKMIRREEEVRGGEGSCSNSYNFYFLCKKYKQNWWVTGIP